MKRIELEQGSKEWLETRKLHIGGSDAPIIMGESPFKTTMQLWEEKVGIKTNNYVSSAMSRGISMEPVARQDIERITGIKFTPVVLFHPTNKFMMCSLDGLSEDGKVILEVKCPNPNGPDHAEAIKGNIPKKYKAQPQHCLECVKTAEVVLYYSFDGERGHIVEAYRDQEYINNMIEKEKEFYRCMQQYVPPSFHLDDYVQMEDPRWRSIYNLYAAEKKIGEESKTREEMYKKQLIELSGGLNAIGDGIKLSKIVRKGIVDYDTILKQHEIYVDLDQFRKPSTESWRITA